jgi:hypothetical protein
MLRHTRLVNVHTLGTSTGCWIMRTCTSAQLLSGVRCGQQSLEVFCRERGTRGMVMRVIRGQSDRGRYEGLVEELRELEGEVTLGAALDTNALAAQMHAELQAVALYTSVRVDSLCCIAYQQAHHTAMLLGLADV